MTAEKTSRCAGTGSEPEPAITKNYIQQINVICISPKIIYKKVLIESNVSNVNKKACFTSNSLPAGSDTGYFYINFPSCRI